jgi:hypothetical protein
MNTLALWLLAALSLVAHPASSLRFAAVPKDANQVRFAPVTGDGNLKMDCRGSGDAAIILVAQPDLMGRFFAARKPGESTITWWEKRRLGYNLILFVFLVAFIAVRRFVDFSTDLTLVLFLLQLPANIWYTGGWVLELLLRHGLKMNLPWFGSVALAGGIAFSFIFAGVFWVWLRSPPTLNA